MLPTLQVAVFKAEFGDPADPRRVPESEKTRGVLGAGKGGGTSALSEDTEYIYQDAFASKNKV